MFAREAQERRARGRTAREDSGSEGDSRDARSSGDRRARKRLDRVEGIVETAIAPVGSGDRRARKRLDRVEEIVETAIALVEQGGLEALTIHRLAAELDIAVSALYRYFPSMDALHAELQRRIVRDYHLALAQHLPEDEAPLAALFLTADHYLSYFAEHGGRLGVLATAMSDPRQLFTDAQAEPVILEVRELLARVTALFRDARARRELSPGDPAERTLAYWALLQGVMQLRKLDRFVLSTRLGGPQLDHRALLPKALRALFLGFGADPRRLSAALRRVEKLS